MEGGPTFAKATVGGRTPKAFASRRRKGQLGFGWLQKMGKPPNLTNFSKLFEIVRKKAKFPERRGPNFPKFFEILRNSSKLFETQSQGIQGLVAEGSGRGWVGGLRAERRARLVH
ncbi:hypothetical protein SBV1_960072 [Verrucomicrobia bacterium]|nr:hypothetical protein SBV1_960072 [Verrucomicrobiota bacterium]